MKNFKFNRKSIAATKSLCKNVMEHLQGCLNQIQEFKHEAPQLYEEKAKTIEDDMEYFQSLYQEAREAEKNIHI